MDLNGALSIASSGLSAIQAQMAVSSQNVANASTIGYVAEQVPLTSRSAGGTGSGVVVGLTTRVVNEALQSALYNQNAVVSELQATGTALAAVSAAQGSTSATSGSTGTLADGVGNLATSLLTLEAAPSNSTAQEGVVSAADALVGTIRQTAGVYATQRQAAQDAAVSGVDQVNTDLQRIGTLSTQIIRQRQQGVGTADLENQRAEAMNDLSGQLSVTFTPADNGDMSVRTSSGLELPTHVASGPLSTAAATLSATDSYPTTIPAITLAGQDVTTQLTGGSLGAAVTLRDQTLPTMQGELDAFAQGLASRFDAQGLTLFSNPDGTVPSAAPATSSPVGELGFSASIVVAPAVVADPALIRDGSHDVAGSGTGASAFTVNIDRGDSDLTLLTRLTSYALGSQAQDGVPQAAISTNGLGASGTLQSPYAGTADLTDLATALVGSQASTINGNTSALSDATAIQTSLNSKITSISGVSVDDEMASMVTLQNAYAANAKVVGAVQTMFTSLLAAID